MNLFMVFPIKAKYLVMGLAAISILMLVNIGNGQVAHLAHLLGLVAGIGILKFERYRQKQMQSFWFKRKGRKLSLVVDNENQKKDPHSIDFLCT